MSVHAPGHEKLDLSCFKHTLGASCMALGLVACGSSDGLPNVTVSISSDTTRAAVRDSISLTWSSTNATACSASGGWSGAKAASGTEVVVLNSEGDVSFAISCRGEGESNSASVVVEVLPPLEILSAGNINVATNEDTAFSVAIEGFSTNRDPLTELVYAVSEAPHLGLLPWQIQHSPTRH